MNIWIGRIAYRQSRFGGFVPFLQRDPSIPSSTSGDNDDNDASSSDFDDEMTSSQRFNLCHS